MGLCAFSGRAASFGRVAHAALSGAEWPSDCKGAGDESPHAINHKCVAAHIAQASTARGALSRGHVHSRLADLKGKLMPSRVVFMIRELKHLSEFWA